MKTTTVQWDIFVKANKIKVKFKSKDATSFPGGTKQLYLTYSTSHYHLVTKYNNKTSHTENVYMNVVSSFSTSLRPFPFFVRRPQSSLPTSTVVTTKSLTITKAHTHTPAQIYLGSWTGKAKPTKAFRCKRISNCKINIQRVPKIFPSEVRRNSHLNGRHMETILTLMRWQKEAIAVLDVVWAFCGGDSVYKTLLLRRWGQNMSWQRRYYCCCCRAKPCQVHQQVR